MAHYPAAHCAKLGVLFGHSLVSIKAEMTFAVMDPADGIFADPGTFCDAVFLAATTNLVPQLCPNVVLNGVSFEDIRAVPYVGVVFGKPATPGTRVAGSATWPTDAAIAIKRTSANLGRSGRGRVYWPLWDNGETTAVDQISGTYAGAIAAALATFQADVEGYSAGLELGIVSFQHGGAPVNPGLFEQTTGWNAFDTMVDSQRRRLLGRGS